MKKFALLFFSAFFYFLSFGQIPAGYYDNATGTGDVLRAALRDITTNGHIKLPYTSTSFDVWDAYAIVDVRPSNNTIVWDMYSDIPTGSNYSFTIFSNQCGTASAEGDCYAREHLTPNSWWGGLDNLANPQYTDLHHLFPADQYVNNKKSAHPLGQISAPTWTSTNGSKIGPCSLSGYGGTVFEPINEYKGDFARATFYIAARYMNQLSTWVTTYPTTEAQYVINSSGNNFKQWYIDMLITWSNNDPVSQKEIDRNNAVYYNTPQHNRNPFVDHPEYICEIWTSSSCTDAPSISNIVNNPASPNSSNTVSLTANVTDNGSVTSAKLQWCTNGTSFGDTITMGVSGAPNYITASSIPAQAGGTTIYYTITAVDNESNSTTSPVQSYMILKDEPTNHTTAFTCDTTTNSSISLTWTDASSGTTPDGYLIKSSSLSYAAINDPVDGLTEVNSTFVHNLTQGTQSYTFTGLSQSTTYYFKVFPYTNSLSNIDYKTSATVPATNCATTAKLGCAADLIISEYIKGTSLNKYIELYNNTGVSVDLSNYSLQLFTNGSPTVSTNNALSGILNNQATIVYKHSSATIYGGITTNNTALTFNGDDAVALFKISDSSYVDIFGRIGEDPGTAWTSGAFTTLDRTLVRNSSVTNGITANPTSGFPTLSTEWTQYAIDNVTLLGAHTMDCPSCASPTVNSNSLSFSAVTQSSITINWLNGDGGNRLVVGKEGSAVSNTPLDGTTYTANSTFGSGDILGTGEYIVYNDSGSSITVSDLTIGLTYYFTIFEYNCAAGSEIYLTPGASENQATYSIVTGSTNDNSFCITPTTGYSTSIMVISTGSFNSNTYTAQLSDLLGSFASPVNIGTLISNLNSEVINCNIPANTPSGTDYKIRVVSDGPILTGTSSDPFEIILNPPPTGTAAQTFCNSATVDDLAATGTDIQWYTASSGGTALATTTALVNGNHYFATQTVNTCESATRFDVTVAINVPAVPTGTPSQTFCDSATVVDLSATGTAIQWYAAPSGGTALATTTALANGSHYFATQTLSTCESATRFDVTVTLSATPVVPIPGTTVQPTCTTATGSVVLGSLPSGNWTINPGNISGNVTSATISSLAISATYNYTVTNASGCTSAGSSDIVINAQPTAPAASTASTSIQPTCALATGTIVVTAPTGVYEYNIDGGTYQASVTFAGIAAGSHNILVRRTTDNTCISTPTAVTVNAQPTAPAAATANTSIQPTCALATGTIVVTAPIGAYEYNIEGGAYQASVTFAGIAAGSHNILVRRTTDNTCISTATAVTVNAQLTAPSAATATTTIQPTCALATGSIVVTAPIAAYEYNIDAGAYQASVNFTGLAAGSHNILVRRTTDNTCISSATVVTVNAQPTAPVVATASTTIQPTCALATGTIVVTAPLGAYEYKIDAGAYQASVTFAGLAAGSHNILVRRTTDNTCISTATAVTVNAQPTAPSAATANTSIQPTCALATGTIVVTAPIGAYEYKIDAGVYQPSVNFAGIATGSHNILVRRATDNTCISSATAVIINAQPTAPAAATANTTIQPTCALATGTIIVTAPTGAYEYNIDGGTFLASLTFAGIAAGSHNILMRRTTDNTCISTATAVTVNAQPTAPSAATASTTIQPTCALATGTIVVTAPIGAYEYKIDAGVYQASVNFTGIAAGSHNILVRRTTDNTCISTAMAVTVNTQPTAPSAATASTTIQPTCALATGTIVITAPTGTYEYNIDGGTYQASVTFTGVASGSHNILVRRTTDNTCISTATAVSVNAQPTVPATPTASISIQPSCALATGTIVITAPTGTYEYNIDGGTYQASVTFTGVASGSHNILVRRTTDNTCISTATAVSVNAQPTVPATPTASTSIQPTCVLATGTIVITAPTGAYEYKIDAGIYQASVSFAGIASGSHNILVRRTTDNTCISSPTAVIVNAQLTTPLEPTASVTAQPSCTTSTGTITVTSSTIGLTFSIDGSDYTNTTGVFIAVAPNTYNITSRNSDGCISPATIVLINAQPLTPSAPTAASSQFFCNSATVANLSATGTVIQWYDASTGGPALTTTTALINGNHYFASQTISVCESTTRFDVTAIIDVPAAPTSVPIQAFCDSGTAANLAATGTAIQWYADSTGGSALAITTALVYGVHYFATQTLSTCESATRLNVTVTINQTPYLTSTLNPDTICSNNTFSYAPTSSVTNTTFYWSRDSVIGISNLIGVGTGNPNETLINTTVAPINVTYVYTITSEGCTNDTAYNVIVHVNPLPAVSLFPFTTVCSQTAAFPLTGGIPIGGAYAGAGVSAGTFYPGSADAAQLIYYTITDSNFCSNAASENMTVQDCTEIKENTFSQEVGIYPNPTNGIFNIVIKNANLTELLVNVIDIQGKEIFRALEKNIFIGFKKEIDLGGLAKGIYYIKLTTNSAVQIQKLIIE